MDAPPPEVTESQDEYIQIVSVSPVAENIPDEAAGQSKITWFVFLNLFLKFFYVFVGFLWLAFVFSSIF